ncbi:MAG: hypothetical protein A4E58_01834 [Syntrophorhabdus sp. PtaB.Bin006]|nr:MAG: hypothetical protein A4E58_01834 [Syntrophorhabdus sp. PtaB.Bin006]
MSYHVDAVTCRHFGKHKKKLISAHAGDGIGFPQNRCKALCSSLQQKVSRVVSECIVDVFESVEVEKHDGNFSCIAVPVRYGKGKTILKQKAVRQPG